MRVLITGGTGFIGWRLALQSRARGDDVRVLAQINNALERENHSSLTSAGIDCRIGSLTDPDSVRRAVDGREVVYHLGAAQHEANVPARHYWDINVTGTANLVEAAAGAGVQQLVYASTIGVYGSAGTAVMDEDTPPRPDNIYGTTKLEAEKRVLASADRVAPVILRISETYGPGDRRLLKLFRGIQNRRFFLVGPAGNWHQPIYVDDLVAGMWLAAGSETARGETFVLAGKEALTTRQMVAAIARSRGVAAPELRWPLWPFQATAVVLEKALAPLGIQPPLHRRRMDFFVKSFRFSVQKARNILEFEPKTRFGDGVWETGRWYREHGLL